MGGLLCTLVAMVVLAPTVEAEGRFKPCPPVRNIFEGSRYEGSDLYRVRAAKVSCRRARKVALEGTERAVADVPDERGRVVVTYGVWTIFDDLRADVDRFVAKAPGNKRIRWLFGDI
jgi:hypothetical protein